MDLWTAHPKPCGILRLVSETILPMETSPQDIQRRIDAGEPLALIDVREPEEFAITRIEGATLIPMRNIPASLQQLKAKAGETTLIVFCHHGVRSLNVVDWLREQGVHACQSMAGGIDAWSAVVDQSVPRY
jgi:rhodanese-related sulfurtransferase